MNNLLDKLVDIAMIGVAISMSASMVFLVTWMITK